MKIRVLTRFMSSTMLKLYTHLKVKGDRKLDQLLDHASGRLYELFENEDGSLTLWETDPDGVSTLWECGED